MVPPKAIRLRMEEDASLLNDCFLADKLGKTLAEIRAMPNVDYLTLVVYYRRQAQLRSKPTRQITSKG